MSPFLSVLTGIAGVVLLVMGACTTSKKRLHSPFTYLLIGLLCILLGCSLVAAVKFPSALYQMIF